MDGQDAIIILLADHNRHDVGLIKDIFQDSVVSNHVYTVKDGEGASDFMHCRAPYENAPRPDLIIMELNLPYKDGRDILIEKRKNPRLAQIPVVIFSESDDEGDVLSCYRNDISCYVKKPKDRMAFLKEVQAIEQFWLGHVLFPPQ